MGFLPRMGACPHKPVSLHNKFHYTVGCLHMTSFTAQWGVCTSQVLLCSGVSPCDKFYCKEWCPHMTSFTVQLGVPI